MKKILIICLTLILFIAFYFIIHQSPEDLARKMFSDIHPEYQVLNISNARGGFGEEDIFVIDYLHEGKKYRVWVYKDGKEIEQIELK